jgi:hypothetical protein
VHLEWSDAPNKDVIIPQGGGWPPLYFPGLYCLAIDHGSGWETPGRLFIYGGFNLPSELRSNDSAYLPQNILDLKVNHNDVALWNYFEGKVVRFCVWTLKHWEEIGSALTEHVWGPPSNVVECYVGKTPTIKEIKVTGVPDGNNPTTNCPSDFIDHKVKLEAVTVCPSDCVITKYSWSGDGVKPGQENPYEYEAAPGTHGKKTVRCTISFTTRTGYSGTATKTENFKLFFVKDGKDKGGDEPNWFTYWIRDEAVPSLNKFQYDPAQRGWGLYTAATGKLVVGPKAAKVHYETPVVVPGTFYGTESFGGPSIKGIDCAAEVVAHELYHKWVWEQWKSHSWTSETDSDVGMPSAGCNDYLPDYYETSVSHTSNSNTDTYGLERLKSPSYRTYGDQEYMAMRAGDQKKGIAANDWANPGKQTNPTDLAVAAAQLAAVGAASSSSGLADAYSDSWFVQAQFTGQIADQGNDTDGDGLFEWLSVTAEVNVTSGGGFDLYASLNGTDGSGIAYASQYLVLGEGVQTIQVDFDGVSIRSGGVDGPYNVTLELANEEGFTIDATSHTTLAYRAVDFDLQSATLSGGYVERCVDTDGDGFYDYLAIDMGVDVADQAEYVVSGWLYDAVGNQIAAARNSSYLSTGSQVVTLTFDGLSINQHRVDGPYSLMYLSIKGNDQAYSIYKAYNTSALSYASFEPTNAWFTDAYETRTENVRVNETGLPTGLFDYLVIGVNVTVNVAGNYGVAGSLCDGNGTMIADASFFGYLNSSGNPEVWLTFEGSAIYEHGADGPFQLEHLTLCDENSTVIDIVDHAFNTSAYLHTEFTIIPEFPMLLFLPTLAIATLVAVAVCKRTRKRGLFRKGRMDQLHSSAEH